MKTCPYILNGFCNAVLTQGGVTVNDVLLLLTRIMEVSFGCIVELQVAGYVRSFVCHILIQQLKNLEIATIIQMCEDWRIHPCRLL